jgi:thioesterase domain-containing protein
MRAIQPEGPYCISGFSFGGIVAIEAGHQLLAMGQQVALLALFDSRPFPDPSRPTWIQRLWERSFFHMSRLLRTPVRAWPDYFRARAAGVGSELIRRFYGKDQPPVSPRHARLVRSLLEYRVTDDPGPIALFLYSARSVRGLEKIKSAWRGLPIADLEIHVVPGDSGDHSTMFEEPHVQVLAEKLKDCLRRAATSTVEKLDSGDGGCRPERPSGGVMREGEFSVAGADGRVNLEEGGA